MFGESLASGFIRIMIVDTFELNFEIELKFRDIFYAF